MDIRCRMAPSPTGKLHIGTAHTALFNFLFAKHHEGKFILRIDDSDPTRSKREYEEDIINNLRWLGIYWDEGPDVGGQFGPYRQSERKAIYQKYIDKLIVTQKAYRCFCTKDELDAKRKQTESEHKIYKYDQKCLNLPKGKIDNLLKQNIPYVVRLINPNKIVEFEDMVRGKIQVDSTEAGDFILTRSDGSPLLNFAVTIDDIEMKITHAIRGEDFLNATPNQILIYEALDAPIPRFANLSFIYAPDHSKLSKRHGATGVSEYCELGYLPEAMTNFLAFLGWNPGDNREIFSVDDLIKEFDMDKVGKNMPTFNINKLDWFNGHYIRSKTDTELVQLVKPYVKSGIKDTLITQIIPLIKERLTKLSDFDSLTSFFVTPPVYTPDSWPDKTASQAHLIFLIDQFDLLDSSDLLEKIKSHGWKVGDFFMSLRIAICGSRFTPPLNEVMNILGEQESKNRIQNAINFLNHNL